MRGRSPPPSILSLIPAARQPGQASSPSRASPAPFSVSVASNVASMRVSTQSTSSRTMRANTSRTNIGVSRPCGHCAGSSRPGRFRVGSQLACASKTDQQWWESSGRKHMHDPLQRGAADRAQRGRRRHLHLGASPAGRMWAGRHGAVTSEQLQLGGFSAQAAGRESMVHSTIKLATHLQRHRCPHGMSTVSRRRSQHTAARGTVLHISTAVVVQQKDSQDGLLQCNATLTTRMPDHGSPELQQ